MANIVRRMILGSSSSSGSNKKIVRSREDIIHEDYLEWKIPNEKIDNIYSIGTFDFKTSYAIKIHEETFNIQNKFQTIQLLSTLALQEFLKKGFRYIHFGLIQVAIKTFSSYRCRHSCVHSLKRQKIKKIQVIYFVHDSNKYM